MGAPKREKRCTYFWFWLGLILVLSPEAAAQVIDLNTITYHDLFSYPSTKRDNVGRDYCQLHLNESSYRRFLSERRLNPSSVRIVIPSCDPISEQLDLYLEESPLMVQLRNQDFTSELHYHGWVVSNGSINRNEPVALTFMEDSWMGFLFSSRRAYIFYGSSTHSGSGQFNIATFDGSHHRKFNPITPAERLSCKRVDVLYVIDASNTSLKDDEFRKYLHYNFNVIQNLFLQIGIHVELNQINPHLALNPTLNDPDNHDHLSQTFADYLSGNQIPTSTAKVFALLSQYSKNTTVYFDKNLPFSVLQSSDKYRRQAISTFLRFDLENENSAQLWGSNLYWMAHGLARAIFFYREIPSSYSAPFLFNFMNVDDFVKLRKPEKTDFFFEALNAAFNSPQGDSSYILSAQNQVLVFVISPDGDCERDVTRPVVIPANQGSDGRDLRACRSSFSFKIKPEGQYKVYFRPAPDAPRFNCQGLSDDYGEFKYPDHFPCFNQSDFRNLNRVWVDLENSNDPSVNAQGVIDFYPLLDLKIEKGCECTEFLAQGLNVSFTLQQLNSIHIPIREIIVPSNEVTSYSDSGHIFYRLGGPFVRDMMSSQDFAQLNRIIATDDYGCQVDLHFSLPFEFKSPLEEGLDASRVFQLEHDQIVLSSQMMEFLKSVCETSFINLKLERLQDQSYIIDKEILSQRMEEFLSIYEQDRVIFDKLKPFTKYRVTISMWCSSSVQSYSYTADLQTKCALSQDELGKFSVSSIHHIPSLNSCNSVDLKWDPRGNPAGYRIAYCDLDSQNCQENLNPQSSSFLSGFEFFPSRNGRIPAFSNGDSTPVRISNLKPGGNYFFIVYPLCEADEHEANIDFTYQSVECSLPPCDCKGDVSKVTVTRFEDFGTEYHDKLRLSWTGHLNPGNYRIRYKTLANSSSGISESDWVYYPPLSEPPIPNPITLGVTEPPYIELQLEDCRNYFFEVLAVDQHESQIEGIEKYCGGATTEGSTMFDGCTSLKCDTDLQDVEVSLFRFGVPDPSLPDGDQVCNGFMVRWTGSANPYGYRIRYRPVPAQGEGYTYYPMDGSSIPNSGDWFFVPALCKTWSQERQTYDLLSYEVEVQAVCPNQSETSIMFNEQVTPNCCGNGECEPDITRVFATTLNPTDDNEYTDRFYVQWSGERNPEGYRIRYREFTDSSWTYYPPLLREPLPDLVSGQYVEVSPVKSCTNYVLEVVAVCRGQIVEPESGVGFSSQSTELSTGGCACRCPSDLSIDNVEPSSGTATIFWSAYPPRLGYVIDLFELLPDESDYRYKTSFTEQNQRIELLDLSRESRYRVQVRSHCSYDAEGRPIYSQLDSSCILEFALCQFVSCPPMSQLELSPRNSVAVQLSWPTVPDVYGYHIYRCTSHPFCVPSLYSLIHRAPASSSSFIDTDNIRPGKVYSYRVVTICRAHGCPVEGEPSTAFIRIPEPGDCECPRLIRFESAQQATAVSLSWTDVGARGYWVELVAVNTGQTVSKFTIKTQIEILEEDGLLENTEYRVQIFPDYEVCRNPDLLRCEYSATVRTLAVCAGPDRLDVTNGPDEGIRIRWNLPPSQHKREIRIVLKHNDEIYGEPLELSPEMAQLLSHYFESVECDKRYVIELYHRCPEIDNNWRGPLSRSFFKRCPCEEPQNLRVEVLGIEALRLHWDAQEDQKFEFRYRQGGEPLQNWSGWRSVETAPPLELFNFDFKPDALYEFELRKICFDSEQQRYVSDSVRVQGRTLSCSLQVDTFDVNRFNEAVITWSGQDYYPQPNGYEYYKYILPNQPSSPVWTSLSNTDTNVWFKDLRSNTKYEFCVRAIYSDAPNPGKPCCVSFVTPKCNTCPSRVDFPIESITAQGAVVSWEGTGEYQVSLNQQNWFDVEGNDGKFRYSLTGLEPCSFYWVYIRSKCGPEDFGDTCSYSFWTRPECPRFASGRQLSMCTDDPRIMLTTAKGCFPTHVYLEPGGELEVDRDGTITLPSLPDYGENHLYRLTKARWQDNGWEEQACSEELTVARYPEVSIQIHEPPQVCAKSKVDVKVEVLANSGSVPADCKIQISYHWIESNDIIDNTIRREVLGNSLEIRSPLLEPGKSYKLVIKELVYCGVCSATFNNQEQELQVKPFDTLLITAKFGNPDAIRGRLPVIVEPPYLGPWSIEYTENGTRRVLIPGTTEIDRLEDCTEYRLAKISSSSSGCERNLQGDVYRHVIPFTIEAKAAVTEICEGQSVNLWLTTPISGRQVTYNWEPADLIAEGQNAATAKTRPLSQTTTFTLTVTRNGCNSSSAAVTVTVENGRDFKLDPSTTAICHDQSRNITFVARGADSYRWIAPRASLPSPEQANASPFQSTALEVSKADTFILEGVVRGCTLQRQVVITKLDLIDFDIRGDSVADCCGSTVIWVSSSKPDLKLEYESSIEPKDSAQIRPLNNGSEYGFEVIGLIGRATLKVTARHVEAGCESSREVSLQRTCNARPDSESVVDLYYPFAASRLIGSSQHELEESSGTIQNRFHLAPSSSQFSRKTYTGNLSRRPPNEPARGSALVFNGAQYLENQAQSFGTVNLAHGLTISALVFYDDIISPRDEVIIQFVLPFLVNGNNIFTSLLEFGKSKDCASQNSFLIPQYYLSHRKGFNWYTLTIREGQVKVYINGAPVLEQPYSVPDPRGSQSNSNKRELTLCDWQSQDLKMYVGAAYDASSPTFKMREGSYLHGMLDELHIINYAMTNDEIFAFFSGPRWMDVRSNLVCNNRDVVFDFVEHKKTEFTFVPASQVQTNPEQSPLWQNGPFCLHRCTIPAQAANSLRQAAAFGIDRTYHTSRKEEIAREALVKADEHTDARQALSIIGLPAPFLSYADSSFKLYGFPEGGTFRSDPTGHIDGTGATVHFRPKPNSIISPAESKQVKITYDYGCDLSKTDTVWLLPQSSDCTSDYQKANSKGQCATKFWIEIEDDFIDKASYIQVKWQQKDDPNFMGFKTIPKQGTDICKVNGKFYSFPRLFYIEHQAYRNELRDTMLTPNRSYSYRYRTICGDVPERMVLSLWSGTISEPWNAVSTNRSCCRSCTTFTSPRLGPVSAVSEDNLSLYPNPTTGRLTVRFDLPPHGPLRFVAYDPSGRQVYRHQSMPQVGQTEFELDLEHLAEGIYLLRIETPEQNYPPARLLIRH